MNSGAPAVEIQYSPAQLDAQRAAFRRRAIAVAIFPLAAGVLLATGPLVGRRRRVRTAREWFGWSAAAASLVAVAAAAFLGLAALAGVSAGWQRLVVVADGAGDGVVVSGVGLVAALAPAPAVPGAGPLHHRATRRRGRPRLSGADCGASSSRSHHAVIARAVAVSRAAARSIGSAGSEQPARRADCGVLGGWGDRRPARVALEAGLAARDRLGRAGALDRANDRAGGGARARAAGARRRHSARSPWPRSSASSRSRFDTRIGTRRRPCG